MLLNAPIPDTLVEDQTITFLAQCHVFSTQVVTEIVCLHLNTGRFPSIHVASVLKPCHLNPLNPLNIPL